MIDNRHRYKDVKWMQGVLLNSTRTRGWNQAVRDEANYIERRRAYVVCGIEHRLLVYEYGTPEECLFYVDEHNKNLEPMQHIEPESDKVWVNI